MRATTTPDRRILDWTDGDGPVVVFEATGVAAVFRQAIEIVAHSGTVVIAGHPCRRCHDAGPLAIVKKELDLLGSRNNTGLYSGSGGPGPAPAGPLRVAHHAALPDSGRRPGGDGVRRQPTRASPTR